jgi:hypothetical protein
MPTTAGIGSGPMTSRGVLLPAHQIMPTISVAGMNIPSFSSGGVTTTAGGPSVPSTSWNVPSYSVHGLQPGTGGQPLPTPAGTGGQSSLPTAVPGGQGVPHSAGSGVPGTTVPAQTVGGISSGLSIAQPLDVLILQFTRWLDAYDLDLLKGREKCDITPLRVTFDQLVQSFEHEACSLNATFTAFPSFLFTTEDRRNFASVIAKLGELTVLQHNEDFKQKLQQWRNQRAPMKLFGQDFLKTESPLVAAAQSATSGVRTAGADESDASSLPPCEEDKIWRSPVLDKLEEHYAKTSSNCFDEAEENSVAVSLKEMLRVKKWIRIKVKTSFLQHCMTAIAPGMRRFSGLPGAQTSWILFWADWEKKVHCIHPSLASNADKLQALRAQLDSPACEKVGVYVDSVDPDAYWQALCDLFHSYGNLDQEQFWVMNQMRALHPTDVSSPTKNEQFFDQVKKFHLRMISMGMDEDYVSRECMNILIARLNPVIKDKFYSQLQMKQGAEESFYQKKPQLWFLRFSDWFLQYMRQMRENVAISH